MKKILLMFCFILMVFTGYSQVKFMGIPVDGTKTEMINKLKQKGFTLCKDKERADYNALEGEFNGRDVTVYVVTYNNKVWRVYVAEQQTHDQISTKIHFNNLVQQFENNKKYIPLFDDQYISDDLNIYNEITYNKNQLSASFFQILTTSEIDKILSKLEISRKDYNVNDEYIDLIVSSQVNHVWILISKYSYDEYWISYYYDNLLNKPNGEDL